MIQHKVNSEIARWIDKCKYFLRTKEGGSMINPEYINTYIDSVCIAHFSNILNGLRVPSKFPKITESIETAIKENPLDVASILIGGNKSPEKYFYVIDPVRELYLTDKVNNTVYFKSRMEDGNIDSRRYFYNDKTKVLYDTNDDFIVYDLKTEENFYNITFTEAEVEAIDGDILKVPVEEITQYLQWYCVDVHKEEVTNNG